MSRVRVYKTSAQIEADRKQAARDAQRRQQQVEQAYSEHTPRQVRFCADMLEAQRVHDDLPYIHRGINTPAGALV